MTTPQAVERGLRLKDARERAGLTQKEAASRARVHYTTLSEIENGKTKEVGFDTLSRIAGVYGLSIDDLDLPRELDQQVRAKLATESIMRTVRENPPAVALGLPQRIRVFIQEFLLELVNANVPDERVDTIRRILSSDEMYRFYVGGEPKEYSEEETLEGIQAHAEAFRQRLRRQGFKLAK